MAWLFFTMASVKMMFWKIGHKITGHNVKGSLTIAHRKFRAFFGTSPVMCAVAWDLMASVRPNDSKPRHLLWALILLKRHCIESSNSAKVKMTEKTFRKWSLLFVDLLEDMPVVKIAYIFQKFYLPIYDFIF